MKREKVFKSKNDLYLNSEQENPNWNDADELKSDKELKSIRIYRKISDGKFVLFYKRVRFFCQSDS